MANAYVQNEVKKILDDKNFEFPLNQAMASAWILAHFKGINLKVLEASNSSLCEYNIIASATNQMQARSMIDEIHYSLREAGSKMFSLEGMDDAEWILLDMGDIIIHVFQENTRDVFDLDLLWKDSKQVAIPQEYYFASNDVPKLQKDDSPENYF